MRKSNIGEVWAWRVLICFILPLCSGASTVFAVSRPGGNRSPFEISFNFYREQLAVDEQFKGLATRQKDVIDQLAYNLSLAQFYADKADGENEKSERLFDKALAMARKLADQKLLVFTLAQRGYYYYRIRRISLAMPNMLEAVFLLDQDPSIHPPFATDLYKQIGYFLGTIGDYKQGDIFLHRALSAMSPGSRSERAALLDNRGLYAFRLNDTARARRHFDEAMALASEAQDDIRKAKIWGNRALLEQGRNNKPIAMDYLRRDLQLSVGKGAELNKLYATNLLARLLLEHGQLAEAKAYIAKIRPFAESHKNLIVHRQTLHQLLLDMAVLEKDEEAEFTQRRMLAAMQDSLDQFDGENVMQQTRWLAQQKIISERLQQNERKYLIEKRQMQLELWIAIFIIVMAVGIFLIAYARRKKEREVRSTFVAHIEKEMLQLGGELSSTKASLAEASASVEEKENTIQRLQQTLKINIQNEPLDNEQHDALTTLLKSHLQTEENWHQFKRAFVLEYPVFYKTLRNDFPELSESNLRIILLLKLKLTANEISHVLGITTDAIKKSRQRLRKKIGEDRYKTLQNALLAV